MPHQVAPGILTQGLGGDHSAMIIGSFRLGGFILDLDLGGGDDFPGNFGTAGRAPTQEPTKKEVIITITLPNGSRHRKYYLISPKLAKVIISVKFIEKLIRKIFIKMNFLWKWKK